jgi:hypothetical protein
MKKALFCIAILGTLLSCTNDNENASREASIKGNDILTFSYEGKVYSSSYDSSKKTLVLDNPAVNSLYKKIQELPELATFERQDGSLEFYDNYNDLNKSLDAKSNVFSKSETAKTAEAAGQIFLYENIDRGGRNIPFDVDALGLNVPDIGTYSFNDRLSSFEMVLNLSNTSYVVTLFRDQNYQGRSYSFNGPSSINGVLYIRNLGDYVMTNRFPSDITWNDQMTSFKVSVYANN